MRRMPRHPLGETFPEGNQEDLHRMPRDPIRGDDGCMATGNFRKNEEVETFSRNPNVPEETCSRVREEEGGGLDQRDREPHESGRGGQEQRSSQLRLR